MRTIIVFLIYVIIVIGLTPFLLICYPLKIRQPFIAVGKAAMRLGQKILGLKIEVSGVEKIDRKSTYVFMANHLSFLDGPMLFMLIPQAVRVILKKEVYRIPIVGWGMHHVEFVPVDRKGIRGGKKSIDEASRLIKEKGYSFLIFPEGTRSRDGKIQAFKRGGFFLALESQAPIVPISIKGTFGLMPKGSFFVRRGKIDVAFQSPVSVQGYNRDTMEKLIEKVRSIIQAAL
jgi:1-acyl-sn-glycerol-3-phosphate acyltransferase